MKAAINSLKWRCRRSRCVSRRVMHLIDSQVVGAMLTKGRTSSSGLRLPLKKHNALVVACGFYPTVAFVHSEENPADLPSRWAWRNGKRRKSARKKLVRSG